MGIKARVLRVEGNIKKSKPQHDKIALVFTNEAAGTMEIHAGNDILFSGSIKEGNKYMKNINFPAVLLPGYDPRWCA